MIKVKVDANEFDRMHADGGVMAQVFFHRFTLNIREVDKSLNLPKERKCVEIYLITIGKVQPDYKQVQRNLKDIALRTISILVVASGMNDFIHIYYSATPGNVGFNYAAVPDEFVFTAREFFDREELRRLFQLGYDLTSSGYKWNKELPWGK